MDVDVRFTLALAGLPFAKVLLNVLKELNPPPAPPVNRSSMRLPPNANPNGFISCVCSALCGWEWRFLLERSRCEEWSRKSAGRETQDGRLRVWGRLTGEEILEDGPAEELPEDVFRIPEREEAEAHVVVVVVSAATARAAVEEAVLAVVVVGPSFLVWKNPGRA